MRRPWLWALVQRHFYPALGYAQATHTIDTVAELSARETFDYLCDRLDLRIVTSGLEHVPTSGRVIVAANHPAGIADGVALYAALRQIRDDISLFANRDAIRAAPNLQEMLIPVEWVTSKRTRKRNRETVTHMVRAFKNERLIVMFPSGRLARPSWRGLEERDWTTSLASLARKYQAPVVPLHIKAHNSWLYYLLYLLNTELRDMTLFRELLNKYQHPYRLTIGAPLQVAGDAHQETQRIRDKVLNELARGLSQAPDT